MDDLDVIPDYICISHTWGRWIIDKAPAVDVPGVNWPVPQNTLFRVEDLPDRLEAAFPGKCIWLDLVCIPQDRSKRALIEIGRQPPLATPEPLGPFHRSRYGPHVGRQEVHDTVRLRARFALLKPSS